MSWPIFKKKDAQNGQNSTCNVKLCVKNLAIREEMLLLHAQTVKPIHITMYWTLELASKLEDAPWPATKEELIDYAMRSGAPLEVVENLEELEDYPTKEDFLFNEDEY